VEMIYCDSAPLRLAIHESCDDASHLPKVHDHELICMNCWLYFSYHTLMPRRFDVEEPRESWPRHSTMAVLRQSFPADPQSLDGACCCSGGR
jgi:hypothetical protein